MDRRKNKEKQKFRTQSNQKPTLQKVEIIREREKQIYLPA
jgi:hypothetical protein